MLPATTVVLCGVLLQSVASYRGFEKPFGCEDTSVDDQSRQGVLDLINRIRSSVALGEFKAQIFLPPASDMDKLRWNCKLEAMAQQAVRNCPSNMPEAIGANAVNYYFFSPDTPASTLRNPMESAVLQWADIKITRWPANNVFDGNPVLRSFANMIRSTAASVGCFSTACSNRVSAACLFSQPNVQVGMLVYTPGNPCRNDWECTTFSPAYCEYGLCVNAERPSTTELPMTTQSEMSTAFRTTNSTTTGSEESTTTSESMMTTTGAEQSTTTPKGMTTTGGTEESTTTPIIRTTSRSGTGCSNTMINEEYRQAALILHNDFRSLVATGQARNGEYVDENAPPAARMNILYYDCLAEQFALNHARTCNRRSSSPFSRPGYQENIHSLETLTGGALEAIRQAVATWNGELEENGIPSNMVFTSQVNQRLDKTVTNVTKIIWGTNRYVGCATQLCNGFYFTSCMYQEPVNVVGQGIYTVGAVCNSCPGGRKACRLDVGLCSSPTI